MSDIVSRIKKRVKASALSKFVPAPKTSNKFSKSVFVGLASIPSREASLRQVVKDLLPQVEQLGVYLNNWDEVPSFLQNPKIMIARSQDHGDVRDNGKFFFIDKTEAVYYATVDDDIAYPADYIAKLVSHQKLLGGSYAVGVHATVYPTVIKKLLRDRHLWHFEHEVGGLLPVDLIGTGTLLFQRAYWQLNYSEIKNPGMADVWFAVAANKRNFGLWVVPRQADWMRPIEQEDQSNNLFSEGRLDDTVQVRALGAVEVGSTRKTLLEQIVRVPKVGSLLSIRDIDALVLAANKVGLVELQQNDFRLYDFAVLIHKRESNPTMDLRLSEVLPEYVQFLLRRFSGRVYANDIDFVKHYKSLLKKIGRANLPEFALRDWDYLKIR